MSYPNELFYLRKDLELELKVLKKALDIQTTSRLATTHINNAIALIHVKIDAIIEMMEGVSFRTTGAGRS